MVLGGKIRRWCLLLGERKGGVGEREMKIKVGKWGSGDSGLEGDRFGVR